MNYITYEMHKSDLKGAKDIKGYFDYFKPNVSKVSDYKLIFILPNGQCLFMPYSPKDKGDRKLSKYDHIVYITKAIDLIIEKLGIDKVSFINQRVNDFEVDELTAAILSLKIPFFYDTGYYDINGKFIDDKNRNTIFEKTRNLTEKQEKTLLMLREALERENYVIGIQVLNADDTLINREKGIGAVENIEESPLKWIFHGDDGDLDFEIADFYNTIKVSDEQVL